MAVYLDISRKLSLFKPFAYAFVKLDGPMGNGGRLKWTQIRSTKNIDDDECECE